MTLQQWDLFGWNRYFTIIHMVVIFFAAVFDMQEGISMQYPRIFFEFKKISVPRFDLSEESETRTQDCGDARTHTYTVHNEERLFLGWISTPFQLQHGFFLTQIACPSANALLFVLSFPRTSMIFSITLAASTMLPWYISRFYIWFGSFLLLDEKI